MDNHMQNTMDKHMLNNMVNHMRNNIHNNMQNTVGHNMHSTIYNNMHTEKNKYKHASPHAVLIDDKPLNCDLFIKHGGKAILYAQPWNATYKGLAPRLSVANKEEFINVLQGYELVSK